MQSLLQDPHMRVLGQKDYLVMCVFGNNSKHLTRWLQQMAWVQFPMYRDELYGLHKTFHSKQPLNDTQQVFVAEICKDQTELKAIYLIMIPYSTKNA